MGYLPKHIKVRRHRWTMRVIANAALAGAMFYSDTFTAKRGGARWSVVYPDGQQSNWHHTKTEAAAHFLVWWFAKNDIWPKRRAAC